MITIDELLRSKTNKDIYSVAPEDTVYRALEIMAEKDLGALPVMKEGKPVGFFSERDYARKIILKGKCSLDTPVSRNHGDRHNSRQPRSLGGGVHGNYDRAPYPPPHGVGTRPAGRNCVDARPGRGYYPGGARPNYTAGGLYRRTGLRTLEPFLERNGDERNHLRRESPGAGIRMRAGGQGHRESEEKSNGKPPILATILVGDDPRLRLMCA